MKKRIYPQNVGKSMNLIRPIFPSVAVQTGKFDKGNSGKDAIMKDAAARKALEKS